MDTHRMLSIRAPALALVVCCFACAKATPTNPAGDLAAPSDLSAPGDLRAAADLSVADLTAPPLDLAALDLGPFVEGAQYEISSKADGQVFSVPQGTSDGSAVQQMQWSNTADQRWKVHAVGSGVYQLINSNSQTCLDVTNRSTTQANLAIWACVSATSQQWTFRDAGGGFYNILNVNSGYCIDLPGGTTTPGATLIQYQCNQPSSDNQKWLLTRVQ
jgi:hypothetical protein